MTTTDPYEDLVHPCEFEGCDQEGSGCWLPDNDDPDQLSAYYCSEHAYEAGFCPGCGMFYGGWEWFDFANPSHLCTDCRSELDDPLDYPDDYGEDWELVEDVMDDPPYEDESNDD